MEWKDVGGRLTAKVGPRDLLLLLIKGCQGPDKLSPERPSAGNHRPHALVFKPGK